MSARCSQSDANGAAGASSRATVTSTSCSVATAAGSALWSGAQKRSRESRTYQFETSSTKAMIARTPAVAS